MDLQLYSRSLRIWRGIRQQFVPLRNGITMILCIPLYTQGELDSLKWFDSLLRKAQVYQAIEMTSNTATERETPHSNDPWAHTSHLHSSVSQQRSIGFVDVGPNSILLAQKTRGLSRRHSRRCV